MSHTDKDCPDWIAFEFRPSHNWHCTLGRRTCDLPTNSRVFGKRYTSCYWMPVRRKDEREWYMKGVPKWYINYVYNAPERMRERIDLLNAKKDFRANGDTDIAPEARPHRHGAIWYYH